MGWLCLCFGQMLCCCICATRMRSLQRRPTRQLSSQAHARHFAACLSPPLLTSRSCKILQLIPGDHISASGTIQIICFRSLNSLTLDRGAQRALESFFCHAGCKAGQSSMSRSICLLQSRSLPPTATTWDLCKPLPLILNAQQLAWVLLQLRLGPSQVGCLMAGLPVQVSLECQAPQV